MSPVEIVAFGAVSGLGEGVAAVGAGEVGDRPRVVIAHDEELARGALARPFAARWGKVPSVGLAADLRASALLERAMAGCATRLDAVRPSWRCGRVGMVLGTSAGGMRSAERAFDMIARGEPLVDVEAPTYFGPMAHATRALGLSFDPAALVLGACASSTIAIGLACRWLEKGVCDVALAGGFDDVTLFVAAGFEALRATTASPPPRPFRVGRDGMSLGEGAAVLALARRGASASSAAVGVYIAGFGASSDAVHLTAPDRSGTGLARASQRALNDAGGLSVDLVSAHATATPYNDAAESRAMAQALGKAYASAVVVHPFKAQIGHTLGAAGALETLACVDAIVRGVLPAAVGDGALDPDTPVRLLARTTAGSPRTALKLASAFGGANAALVVSTIPNSTAGPSRSAFVHAAVRVEGEPPIDALALDARMTIERLGRTDRLVRLALAAVARLEQRVGLLAGAGIVMGSAFATLETNAIFFARLRELGGRCVEPRRFPYTSPNAAPGECSIAFGLTGPSFAMGGGMHAAVEALAAAALLVEAGDADRIVVVAADDEVGGATRALGGEDLQCGAVALLLSADGRGARARIGDATLRRGLPVSERLAPGHLALVPLVGGALPDAVTSSSPPDSFARVALHPI